jgi:hypothetical protein
MLPNSLRLKKSIRKFMAGAKLPLISQNGYLKRVNRQLGAKPVEKHRGAFCPMRVKNE